MKFKCKPVALAVAQVLGISGAMIVIGAPAQAQDIRVSVTGTSIKRVEAEGSLPVITLDRTFIEQSGATNASELIQSLPAMQNFVPQSSSVNGAGAGVTTAALHALPSKYTLVLVNGQRTPGIALGNTQGGGSGVNIQSIPLDAVERVEILTDGASAIYGADAVAGVVNFILKKTETVGNAYAQASVPQTHGGGGWNAGISKGWGDLDKDKWNVMFTYEHDRENQVKASQRDFSKKGAFFPFGSGGVNYFYNGATSNTEPANVQGFLAYPKGGSPSQAVPYTINPYYVKNGNCGSQFASILTDTTPDGFLGAIGSSCRFNYAAFVQDIPTTERNAGVLNGTWRLNPDTTLWANLNLSSTTVYAQYAPPAQPLGINPTTRYPSLYNAYVVPFLNANNLEIVPPSSASSAWAQVGYRAVSQGGRADNYVTDWTHFATGIDGKAWGWDYTAKVILAEQKLRDDFAGGYTDSAGLKGAIAAGIYDPVFPTPAGAIAIKPFIVSGLASESKSKLTSLQVNAQHDMWQMAGGTSILALGASYDWNHYTVEYGDLNLVNSGYSTQGNLTTTAIGGPGGAVPFDAKRNNWGIYGEAFFPVLKNLEVTGSVRYDYYDKVYSSFVFSNTPDADGVYQQIANADLGNTFNDTTWKVSARWNPVQSVLVRGSYGTGFRAPALGDIAGPLVFNGSTANSYRCPFPGTSGCLPGSAQYDLLAGPNGYSGEAGLKPEKSTQWTVGGRWDDALIKGLSIGADWWNVELKDQVISQGIAEQVGFGNPQQYVGLFTNPYLDPVGGFNTIAFSQVPFNGGQAKYEGIDYDVSYKTPTAWGLFSVNWTGTYIIKAQYNFSPGDPYLSSLGQYGPDQQVVFRNTSQLQLALTSGAWTNVVTGHYKSGYHDQSYVGGSPANIFFNVNGGPGDQALNPQPLEVPSYTTWDWQSAYNINKDWKFTFGINNIFDRAPPLTLQSGGGGNQVGYDGRYTDAVGRLYYFRLGIKF